MTPCDRSHRDLLFFVTCALNFRMPQKKHVRQYDCATEICLPEGSRHRDDLVVNEKHSRTHSLIHLNAVWEGRGGGKGERWNVSEANRPIYDTKSVVISHLSHFFLTPNQHFLTKKLLSHNQDCTVVRWEGRWFKKSASMMIRANRCRPVPSRAEVDSLRLLGFAAFASLVWQTGPAHVHSSATHVTVRSFIRLHDVGCHFDRCCSAAISDVPASTWVHTAVLHSLLLSGSEPQCQAPSGKSSMTTMSLVALWLATSTAACPACRTVWGTLEVGRKPLQLSDHLLC